MGVSFRFLPEEHLTSTRITYTLASLGSLSNQPDRNKPAVELISPKTADVRNNGTLFISEAKLILLDFGDILKEGMPSIPIEAADKSQSYGRKRFRTHLTFYVDIWMELSRLSSHAIFVEVRGLLILIIPTRRYDVTKAKFFLARILVAVDVTNRPDFDERQAADYFSSVFSLSGNDTKCEMTVRELRT